MNLKNITGFILLAILGLAWFSLLIPKDLFPDPDALYHATMAKLTWEHGFVDELSWLDLTTLGEHFADQHYLLHLFQSPFIAWLGIQTGSRFTSVIFALIAVLGIAYIFYKLKLKPFWLWSILLMFTQPFCSRLVQGKASPLAILIWLIFSGSVIWQLMNQNNQDKKYLSQKKISLMIIFISGLVFSLTHGGWILLIITSLLLILGSIIFNTSFNKEKIFLSIKLSPWSSFLAVTGGVLTGVFLHPDRKDLFDFLWIQVIQIGLKTPANLHMGMEWSSATLTDAIGIFSVFGLILLLSIVGMVFAQKKPLPKNLMLPIISWGFVCASLLALSIKSVRFAEYLQPALALWVAMLAQFVDWKNLMKSFQFGQGKYSKYYFSSLVIFCLSIILLNNSYGAYTSLRNAEIFKDDQYTTAMKAINQKAQKGDRVFHASWDEFPVLFSQNQNLKYISGLDPTFLYEASTTLSDDYESLVFNATSSTQADAWSLIHDRMNAKFIMLDTNRWKDLHKLIESDSRYEKLLEIDGEAAYQIIEK